MESPDLLRPKVFLIEDSDLDRELFNRAFAQSGVNWELSVFKDGEVASEALLQGLKAKGGLPDLILMDLNLPRKTGRQLLVETKRNPFLRRIPILIYSGTESHRDVVDSLSEHANGFLRKPVFLNETVKLIKRVHEFWFLSAKLVSYREYFDDL